MKDIYEIYEGILDKDNKASVGGKSNISNVVFDGLMSSDVKDWQDTCKILIDYLKKEGKEAKLGKIRNRIVPMDNTKDYIHIVNSMQGPMCVEILVPGLKMDIWVGRAANYDESRIGYDTTETKLCFYQVYANQIPYEVPAELEPFVNKCVEYLKSKGKLRKFNR